MAQEPKGQKQVVEKKEEGWRIRTADAVRIGED